MFFKKKPPAPVNAEAAKKNAAAVLRLLGEELGSIGFGQSKGTALWRKTNLKLDVVKIDIIPKTRCLQWGEPQGSFLIDPYCIFPFLPSDGGTQPQLTPEKGFGQLRITLRRGLKQPEVHNNNIWWAGDDAKVLAAVMEDLLGQINGKVLPFFSRFDDPAELLRTFIEDDMAMESGGPWGFGKKGSTARLLLTGFAALECGKWQVAADSFNACRAAAQKIKGDTGANILARNLPLIDTGLSCAKDKRTWQAG